MKQGYWVVRTYEAGIIGEKTKFWVQGERPSGKSRRKEKSEIRKQEQNEYSALKAMSRLANANFHKDDLLLGLDYSEEGLQKVIDWAKQKHPEFDTLTEEEQQDLIMESAWHEAELCLRRVDTMQQTRINPDFLPKDNRMLPSEGQEQATLFQWAEARST